MIPVLSFRLKLLLAMMLVVAGVSISTLYVTQQRVQVAYERLVKKTILRESSYLPREQEARLANVKEKCGALAASVRLQAALDAGDVDNLYTVALDELGSLLLKRKPPAAAPPPAPGKNLFKGKRPAGNVDYERIRQLARAAFSRATAAELFRFMDADGAILIPKEEIIAPFRMPGVSRARLDQQLNQFGQAIGKLDGQYVGYLLVELQGAANRHRILEVVVTPVIDAFSRQVLGAFVLGFPYSDSGEEILHDLNETPSGVWLNDHLHSSTIAESAKPGLIQMLRDEVPRHEHAREELGLLVEGIPHRVFYTPLNSGSPLPRAYKVGLYSLGDALQAQAELRTQILFFTALAVIGALLISLLLSHGLAVPILELVRSTEAIKEGRYDVKVRVGGQDELGRLAASFNDMADGLALKDRYHNILNMVTDRDVADELISGKVALGGERRHASVLFCDIRGFTALSQDMDPAEVVQMLNEHMTALTGVITANKGVVDKFIGDAIMAIFGAPKSYGDDTFNAVKAGLEIIRERAKLNQTSKYKILLGVGVATGDVLAGNMGSEDRSNYTVIGAHVNLASRLCGVAGRMELVVSEATREQLGDRVVAEETDPMSLKGFSGSVRAFKIRELRPA